MGELERQGWREVLAPYPVEDILEALEQIRKTPREFTGRPGAVEVTLAIDAILAERARLAKVGETVREMQELGKRKAAGEQFYGLKDLSQEIRNNSRFKAFLDREAELERQKQELKRKHEG